MSGGGGESGGGETDFGAGPMGQGTVSSGGTTSGNSVGASTAGDQGQGFAGIGGIGLGGGNGTNSGVSANNDQGATASDGVSFGGDNPGQGSGVSAGGVGQASGFVDTSEGGQQGFGQSFGGGPAGSGTLPGVLGNPAPAPSVPEATNVFDLEPTGPVTTVLDTAQFAAVPDNVGNTPTSTTVGPAHTAPNAEQQAALSAPATDILDGSELGIGNLGTPNGPAVGPVSAPLGSPTSDINELPTGPVNTTTNFNSTPRGLTNTELFNETPQERLSRQQTQLEREIADLTGPQQYEVNQFDPAAAREGGPAPYADVAYRDDLSLLDIYNNPLGLIKGLVKELITSKHYPGDPTDPANLGNDPNFGGLDIEELVGTPQSTTPTPTTQDGTPTTTTDANDLDSTDVQDQIDAFLSSISAAQSGFSNSFAGSSDNDIIEKILSGRLRTAQDTVARAGGQGNLNETGSLAANQELGKQQELGNLRLTEIGDSILGGNNALLESIFNDARTAAANQQQTFSDATGSNLFRQTGSGDDIFFSAFNPNGAASAQAFRELPDGGILVNADGQVADPLNFDLTPFLDEASALQSSKGASLEQDILDALGLEPIFDANRAIQLGGDVQGLVSGAV
jgi:hypothetical protein